MTTGQSDYQRFTIPRWLLAQRLFGRNPLVRVSDRVEALVSVLAVVLSLLTLPIAAAVGTAVYESRSNLYTEQDQNRSTVAATVVEDSAAPDPWSKTTTARARWFAAGAEHTGVVQGRTMLRAGDSVEVWVDEDGAQVSHPVRSAVDEAVVTALVIWLSVAITATAFCVGTRAVLNRIRHARWQHDFDTLVSLSDGHSQP